MNDDNNNDYIELEEDRLYFDELHESNPMSNLQNRAIPKKSKLPRVVEAYVKSATEVSKYNEVPSAVSFYTLLGQICKDMVAIPSGRRVDDTRVHFIWMQTSGTGKSTLYDFFGPVSDLTFELINKKYHTDFDVFSIKDTTDAALVGSMGVERVEESDDNGNVRMVDQPVQIMGALEGAGLAAYDEFEYSGVFKQSQHKENVIMYLNTFMNSLHGENWIITKKLKDGDTIECRCQRSTFATTYIPTMLTTVIAEKGVMQRTLIYIREVPQQVQDELRDAIIDEVGTIVDRDLPITKYAQNFVLMYETLKKHFDETGKNPLKTIKFGRGITDAIKNESWKMRNYVSSSRPEVFTIASNFITRLNGTMVKMAVLSCIAEAPSLPVEQRFIVTDRHVRQASFLVRQCYKSLVSWLDTALKVKQSSLEDKANMGAFRSLYYKMKKKDDDWVNKTALIEEVRKTTHKGQASVYRWLKDLENNFEEKKIGRSTYIKIKEVNKE
tara:strand:+ start:1075 stop:2565 length:1491 start_codon:yes stop_codon:yes gene_type:complete